MGEPIGKKSGQLYNFEESIGEILGALDQIKKSMPNGELKIMQDKIENLQESWEELKQDNRDLKKILMDPEDGVIVRLNRSIEVNEKYEEYRKEVLEKKVETLTQLESWKENVTKILWVLFTAVVSIILNIVFKGHS